MSLQGPSIGTVIQRQFGIVVALFACTLAATGAVDRRATAHWQRADDVSAALIAASQQVEGMRAQMGAQASYALTRDPRFRRAFEAGVALANTGAAGVAQAHDAEADRLIARAVRADRVHDAAVRGQLFPAIERGDRAAVAALFPTVDADARAVLRATAAVRSRFVELHDHRVAAALRADRLSTLAAILATLLAAGVALLFARVTARSIASRASRVLDGLAAVRDRNVAEVNRGIRAIAVGTHTQRVVADAPAIVVDAGDELGRIAHAVNDIRGHTIETVAAYDELRRRLAQALGTTSCLEELDGRLTSLERRCLTDLEEGLAAIDTGDLTHAVTSATEALAAADGEQLGELGAIFNRMLARAQRAVEAYERMREELRRALGDESCLDDLRRRLDGLDAQDLTHLEAGLGAISTRGDLGVRITTQMSPITPAVPGRDIGELGTIYNRILARAQSSIGSYEAMRTDLSVLAQRAGAVAAGDLTAAVAVKGDDDQLGSAFTEMTSRLATHVGEIAAELTAAGVLTVEEARDTAGIAVRPRRRSPGA